MPKEYSPFSASPNAYSSHRAQGEVDLGGVSEAPGLKIHWAGSDPRDENIRPITVIEATIDRLEAEQKTNLGSDANARALIDLMQARDKLRGEAEDVDGVLVIR